MNKFIVFEGLDGSGKTTLIKKLAEFLDQNRKPYIITREPGGTQLGDEIRNLLLKTDGQAPTPRTELLLYEASRSQHVDLVIRPKLKKGWVLCDRFSASSIAFQSGGRHISENQVQWLNDFATESLSPDLNILLDLSTEESEKRRALRNETIDRMEKENSDFHNRIRKSFLNQAAQNPSHWLVLDASLPQDKLAFLMIEHLKGLKWLS